MSGETIYPAEHESDREIVFGSRGRIIPRFDGIIACPRCSTLYKKGESHVCADLPHAPYDNINPSHYKAVNGMEAIDVMEAFVPDKPHRWAPLKYLLRCGKKPGQDEVQELRKAIWWIEREIASIMVKRNSNFRSVREGSETVGGST